jgi:hypothetical protein
LQRAGGNLRHRRPNANEDHAMHAQPHTQLLRRSCALLALIALAACGDGGGGEPSADPPATPPVAPPVGPPANRDPVAAFTAPGSAAADASVPLDASASTDADGDTLTYRWDFGDGALAGGARVAHAYSAGGSYTIKLRVSDGRGGVNELTRSITVAAPPAAVAQVDTLAVVRDIGGAPISGVTITAMRGGVGVGTGNTDAQGRGTVRVGTGTPVVLKFSKSGYSDQFRDAALPGAAESGYMEVTMQPRASALTLADAAAGGSLTGRHGAKVSFEPNSLVDAAGNAVTGAVQVFMTPVDVAAHARAFPGRFEGRDATGQNNLLLSYGTVEYALNVGGNPVQLAPGKTATIEIPIFTGLNDDGSPVAAGQTSPLWVLDERSGGWRQEGTGTVVEATTPSGFALRAQVAHFSWWNHDAPVGPNAQGRPKPRCLVDTNADGVLEDLTGTGHCWHAGTGPEQPSHIWDQSANDRRHALSARRSAVEPRTVRGPAFSFWRSAPPSGGQVFAIPSNREITFRSYALNGTLFGMKTVNFTPGQEGDVDIVLAPVAAVDTPQNVAVPYRNNHSQVVPGEVDEFIFNAEAGKTYNVRVVASLGSAHFGGARVLDSSGAQVQAGAFSISAFDQRFETLPAGATRVQVTAGDNAPGAYRIEITEVTASSAGCTGPNTVNSLVIPSSQITVPRNASRCYTGTLAAEQILEVRGGGIGGSLLGEVTVRNAAGTVVARDRIDQPNDNNAYLMFAAATAGEYTVQITNETLSNRNLGNFSISSPPGTALPLGGSVTLDSSNQNSDGRRLVVLRNNGSADIGVLVRNTSGNVLGRAVMNPGDARFDFGNTLQGKVHRPLDAGALAVLVLSAGNPPQQLPPVEVRSVVPEVITLDSTITGTWSGPDESRLLVFDNTVNPTTVSRGVSSDTCCNGTGARMRPPSGVPFDLFSSGGPVVLNETGAHTVQLWSVQANVAPGTAYTFRLNRVTPTPVSLAQLQAGIDGTLLLGQWPTMLVDLPAGLVGSLQLTRPTGSSLVGRTSLWNGTQIQRSADVTLTPNPFNNSPAFFIDAASTREITVYATSFDLPRAAGAYSVKLVAPTPAPVPLGSLFTRNNLASGELVTFSTPIATAGSHRLCTLVTGPSPATADGHLETVLWGPSATRTNYVGDMTEAFGVIDGFNQTALQFGDLRTGTNTVSIVNRFAQPVNLIARLVPNPAPADLVVNGPAQNGTVDGPCSRSVQYRFAATAGTTYTVRVTASTETHLRVYKQTTGGSQQADWLSRTSRVVGDDAPLTPNVQASRSFTIGTNLGDNYVIEVESKTGAAGTYTVSVTSP